VPVWSEPKTKQGRRQIAIDPGTVAVLRALRKEQAAEPLAIGPGYVDHDLVFALPDGRPLHPERFSRTFTELIARQKLPAIRVHDLRHTWATLALEAGIHPKVVSERLGHATVSITLDIYSHVSPAMQSDPAERVAALIFEGGR
jgi:integrase